MDERLTLMEDDKEKLVDEILRQRDEIKNLRLENETIRQELGKLKQNPPAKSKKLKTANAVAKKSGKPSHLWGRKKGHPGAWRPTPDHVDREVEQTLSACPDCHHSLGPSAGADEHIQEDIIPARVEVTRFLRHRYWCPCCEKMVTAPYASDEVPSGYLGPRALATMVWLKYYSVLPGNKIKDILNDLCGMTVSEGAIAKALQRLGIYLQIETVQILKAIRNAPYKHADETGWKINGVGHQLWAFLTDLWAFVHIDKSRGSKVPKALLGFPHQGVVVSDFYSAYNKLSGEKQKCLVHLNRDIHKAREAFPPGQDLPPDFHDPDKKLRRLLDDAMRLSEQRSSLHPLIVFRRVRRLKKRLLAFASAIYPHPFWKRIGKRLFRHRQELLTFLDRPGVPPDNNPAERGIRPHVIVRNRSFQNRTDTGALAHERLCSILQTLRLQKRNPVESLIEAYPKHRQGVNTPVLFPAIPAPLTTLPFPVR
jgi:transposase